jgi:hypothetical protein
MHFNPSAPDGRSKESTYALWSLVLGAICIVSATQAQTLPGTYTNSWIGNTYGTRPITSRTISTTSM